MRLTLKHLSFYRIKEQVHSIAVQALAGGTMSALKTQIAFIIMVVNNNLLPHADLTNK